MGSIAVAIACSAFDFSGVVPRSLLSSLAAQSFVVGWIVVVASLVFVFV